MLKEIIEIEFMKYAYYIAYCVCISWGTRNVLLVP